MNDSMAEAKRDNASQLCRKSISFLRENYLYQIFCKTVHKKGQIIHFGWVGPGWGFSTNRFIGNCLMDIVSPVATMKKLFGMSLKLLSNKKAF